MGVVLGKMFLSWPMFGASREQISALTVRYLDALASLPVWAVQEAVKRWGRGDWKLEFGESFDKIPSSATLKRIAETEIRMAENMLHSLEKLDAAVAEIPRIPPSPEERERMAAKFKALSEELGQRNAARAQADWPLKQCFDDEYHRRREKPAAQTEPEQDNG